MAQAQRQLGLYESTAPAEARHRRAASAASAVASTAVRRLPREGEARYGFRPDDDDDPTLDRPRALCFECFRVEVTRRRLVRERMARGWNANRWGCRCRKRCGHSQAPAARADAARHASKQPGLRKGRAPRAESKASTAHRGSGLAEGLRGAGRREVQHAPAGSAAHRVAALQLQEVEAVVQRPIGHSRRSPTPPRTESSRPAAVPSARMSIARGRPSAPLVSVISTSVA